MIELTLIISGLAIGLALGYVFGLKSGKVSSDNLKQEFKETVDSLNVKLQAATEEMLRRRQNEFAQFSGDRLDHVLAPLQHSIREMREAVAVNTRRSSELDGKLQSSLYTLLEQTAAARESADRLATALRGNNRVQGQWGEVVLKELLISQGLVEGRHFDIQSVITDNAGNTVKNESGRSMRPDVVVHLDRERDVVIDAKVSLSAYLDYVNADSDGMRDGALSRHIRSMESHVDELAKKDYASRNGRKGSSAGFVIMFVPNSAALALAVDAKPNLWRNAMERNVFIADERSLYASLKIIELTWRQIAQAENHDKVYALAQEMLDRVGRFLEAYMEIGNRLSKTTESFEAGLKKLSEDKGSIPATCRKLRDLGAKPSRGTKGVPPELFP